MKKKTSHKRLRLSSETLRQLTTAELPLARGGNTLTCTTCNAAGCGCPPGGGGGTVDGSCLCENRKDVP